MIRAPGTRPHSLSVSYAGEPFFLRVASALGMVVPSTLLAQAEEEHSNNQSCGFDARNLCPCEGQLMVIKRLADRVSRAAGLHP